MYVFILLFSVFFALAALYLGQKVLRNSTFLHRPVYVPSTPEMQRTMLELANCKKTDAIIDLGSGDGSLLMRAAKMYPDCTIHGIEINPLLVWKSRQKIVRTGLQNQVVVIQGSLWNVDLTQYDVVLLYATAAIMGKLEQKVLHEMRPGSKVVSSVFAFPNIPAHKRKDAVFCYVV